VNDDPASGVSYTRRALSAVRLKVCQSCPFKTLWFDRPRARKSDPRVGPIPGVEILLPSAVLASIFYHYVIDFARFPALDYEATNSIPNFRSETA